jgi:hypothetical protein
VYVEVYDQVDSATMTGRLCYPLSALFLAETEADLHGLLDRVATEPAAFRAPFEHRGTATAVRAFERLVDKHRELEQEPSGLARIYGQIAFAHAALGERGPARQRARRTLALNRRERRAYLALAVSIGLVPAGAVVRLAHAAGKGI